jgi:uncharacterized protein (TIGR01619 family)
MSKGWLFFPCNMEDKTAFVFFDHGISDTLDDVAGDLLLSVKVTFKAPREDGLPTNDEFDALKALEDDLSDLAEQHDALYVGRVSVDGKRHFQLFTDEPETVWAPRVAALGERHGYPLRMTLREDKEHAGYWDELYPTADDWQVIADMSVLDALEEQGDDGSQVRLVEHWSYFPTEAEAGRFSSWLKDNGYAIDANKPGDEDDPEEDNGQICVRFSHETALGLDDITSHTIELRRQAEAFGGEYDGWECVVCAAEDA